MSDTKFADVPEHVLKSDRPDMAHVKLSKALPGLREGEVLFVDINSARSLVGRGDADFVDPNAEDAAATAAIPRQTGRANVSTMIVKGTETLTADQLARAAAEGATVEEAAAEVELVESGVGAGETVEVQVPKASDNKATIVAYAEGKLTDPSDGHVLTTAELEAKSKTELVADLKLD